MQAHVLSKSVIRPACRVKKTFSNWLNLIFMHIYKPSAYNIICINKHFALLVGILNQSLLYDKYLLLFKRRQVASIPYCVVGRSVGRGRSVKKFDIFDQTFIVHCVSDFVLCKNSYIIPNSIVLLVIMNKLVKNLSLGWLSFD